MPGMREVRGGSRPPNLQLQLLTNKLEEDHSTQLQLSIGSSEITGDKSEAEISRWSPRGSSTAGEMKEQLRIATAEKAYAEEARQTARRQMEAAEHEFANAKRIRQTAQAELQKAQALRDHATRKINASMLEITCRSCRSKFQQALLAESSSSSSSRVGLNFISTALRDWEVKKANQ